MKKIVALLSLVFFISIQASYSQEHLPNISVTEYNGKVIVSWQNFYKKPIINILIQRSYDSIKNFSTIGTVLNPLNKENGYLDAKPPYNRMYYRVLISFDGGLYEIGKSSKPEIQYDDLEEFNVSALPKTDSINIIQEIRSKDSTKLIVDTFNTDMISLIKKEELKINDTSKTKIKKIEVEIDSVENLSLQKNSSLIKRIRSSINYSNKSYSLKKIKTINVKLENKIVNTQWDYPSNKVFINNQNLISIQLKKTAIRKYSLKIFDESDNLVLSIKKINEDFFYLDKSNFRKSGWYHFEILNDGELIEKNKFQVLKDKSPK
jgi:hypothetical protein